MPLLEFKGKGFIYAHHLGVEYRNLVVDKKKSITTAGSTADIDGNLIIHGDNLHALKALMPRYAGRINCIYIDPPYNTGNEGWIYNDRVNSPLMKQWLKENGAVDGEDPERHDKWLCMMWPRLQLLRELLAEEGVIFISIDDNEHHRLRMMMDEIFGKNYFIGEVIVVVNKGGRDYKKIATQHEYVLIYGKSENSIIYEFLQPLKEFKYKDISGEHNIQDLKNTNPKFDRTNRPNLYFPIYVNIKVPDSDGFYPISLERKHQSDEEVYPMRGQIQGCWRWSKNKIRENIGNNSEASEIIGYRKQKNGLGIAQKDRRNTRKPRSIWDESEMQTTKGTKLLNELGLNSFHFPKSLDLIKRITTISTTKNDIILDSFAGSGTTAHAVLALNKEDGGNRKFILVECEEYANTITAERVRRVIKGVPGAKDNDIKNGLGGSFTFCTLGEELSVENMLTGKNLPDYETLAHHLAHVARGITLDRIKQGADYLYAETQDECFYLIYRPDLDFSQQQRIRPCPSHGGTDSQVHQQERQISPRLCTMEIHGAKRINQKEDHLLPAALGHSQDVW